MKRTLDAKYVVPVGQNHFDLGRRARDVAQELERLLAADFIPSDAPLAVDQDGICECLSSRALPLPSQVLSGSRNSGNAEYGSEYGAQHGTHSSTGPVL